MKKRKQAEKIKRKNYEIESLKKVSYSLIYYFRFLLLLSEAVPSLIREASLKKPHGGLIIYNEWNRVFFLQPRDCLFDLQKQQILLIT